MPETSSRLARGWTRTAKVTVLVARCCEISRCDGGFSILVHIVKHRREMAAGSLACLASPEQGRANADFGRALGDGRFEIVGHAHRKHRQVLLQLRLLLVSQFAQFIEI